MFTRMTALKTGAVDEDGMGINAVDKALKAVGLTIRDGERGFKDLDDVLSDVAKGWDTYDEFQKSALTGAIAGTRQANILVALLDNEEMARKLVTEQIGKETLAEERYAETLDRVEAAQNRMTASWEKLVMSSITSDMISGFYESVGGMLDFVDAIGGIPKVLEVVIPLLILFNLELIKTKALSTWGSITAFGTGLMNFGKSLSVATKLMRMGVTTTNALNVAFGATAVTMASVALAFASVVAVIYTYNEQVVKTQEAGLENTANEWSKIFDTVKSDGGDAVDVLKKYKEGIDAINKAHEEGGVVADLFVNKEKMIVSGLGETVIALGETTSSYDEYIKKVKEAASLAGYQVDENGVYKSTRYGKEYVDDIAIESAQNFNDAVNKELAEQEVLLFGTPELIQQTAEKDGALAYESFRATLDGLLAGSSEDLIEKSMKGELSFDDVSKIPEEYLSALDVVNGKLKLNIDTVKELQLAEAEQALQSAINAGAKQSEIDVLQLYYDQLLQASQNTFGAFSQTAWHYDELLWTISNDAVAAGFSFVDLEGNALNSADSIHSFLASSDQAFNSFVQQAAIATGRSAQEVMNLINGMVAQTYNNTVSMINSLGGMVGGLSPDERDEAKSRGMNLPKVKQVTPVGGALFSGKTPSYSGSGGSGGGSSKDDSETKEAERLREIEKEISDARNDATKSLKNQLKIYKQMVDERKKLLDTMKEERSYQQDLEEKQDNVADIQNQIAELSLDDSAEAQAQVLALQEQLAEAQQELGNLEFEHGIDQQQTALDDELSRVENLVENAIMAIEGIDASSLASFTSQLSTILAGLGSAVPQFHTGVSAGFVGGRSESKENEQFAKLLKGELVISPDQMSNFMNKTIPSIMSGTPSVSSTLQGMEIGQLMNFNINGGLDKSVLPSIEKIANMVVDKLNDNMLIRGTKRGAGLFSA